MKKKSELPRFESDEDRFQEAKLIKRRLQETGKKAQPPEDQPGAESIASARADEDTYD